MATVLLAEDDPDTTELYTQLLKQSGFDVVVVDSGEKIEEALSKNNIDIILSDTQMPEMDGDVACRKLLEQGKLENILVIGMSSVIDYSKHWKGIAHEFFYKPGKRDTLGEAVKNMYAAFSPGQRRYKQF